MHVALDTRARIGTMKNMGERLPLFRSFRMTGFDGEEQFVHAPDGIDMRSGAFVGVRHHHGIPSWRGAAPGSAYGRALRDVRASTSPLLAGRNRECAP